MVTHAEVTMSELTVLTAIQNYKRKHAGSPSLYEIVDLTGLPVWKVRRRVRNLTKKGLIKRDGVKSRSLTINRGTIAYTTIDM